MKLNKTSIGFKTVTVLLKPLFCLWYNPQVVGKGNIPENGAVVIACNHKHIMDQCMAIIATKRTVNYMAKSEYFKGKAAFFFKMTGCICVNRNGNDEAAKNSALKVLKKGGALGIFPEGTRNKTEELLMDFKYGAASLACKTNATVIPVAVTGDYKFRSKNLMSRIGSPISVEGKSVEQVNCELKNSVSELIRENLESGYGTADEYAKAEKYFGEKITDYKNIDFLDFDDAI